jgi:rhodanese-related sulfurtransferase
MNHHQNQVFSRSVLGSLAGAMTLALGACQTETSDRDLRPVGPQEAVDLSVPRSEGAFGGMTNPVWVDPRIGQAYDAGHIPGALSMPFGSGDFEDMAQEKLSGRQPILVYGDGFQDILADAASKRLISLGFKKVYTLRGGIQQWEADGYEIIRPGAGEDE